MLDRPAKYDLPRITLGVIAIVAMAAAAAWVMMPFVASTVWATMIVISTWPWLTAVQKRVGGKRGPAVALMVVGLLAVLVVPVWLGISTIVSNVDRLPHYARTIAEKGLPPPPDWVAGIPLVGERAAEAALPQIRALL